MSYKLNPVRDYNTYAMEYIGTSKNSILVFEGADGNGVKIDSVPLFYDDYYPDFFANIADENAKIDSRYKPVAKFNDWLKIFDDTKLTQKYEGEVFIIYTYQRWCIIQIINQVKRSNIYESFSRYITKCGE